MPHMTQAYRFEWKVLEFAESLATKLSGTEGSRSFVMALDRKGAVQALHFECPRDSWHQVTEELHRIGRAYLLFDSFDAPESTWLAWRNIDRLTMERLIGDVFADTDFVKASHASPRAPDLDPPNTYPTSWQVMF
jgi:hypothetical protein